LAAEIPGAFKPNQYENPNGPMSHYESTGPEIWRDTDERITHFVAGVGTGGTISGTGRFLKDASDGRVRVVGIDPVGSVYSGGTGRPYLVEGVGEDIWPGAYDQSVADEIVAVDDAASFAMTKRLAREEGLLVGGSSGMAVAGALEVAKRLGPDDVMVVLLPDGGRGYLGKIFNDDWMRHHGFEGETEGAIVRDILDAKPAELPDIVYVAPTATVREAIAVMNGHGVSQLLVLSADPPVVLGEVVGSVRERELLAAVVAGAGMDDPIADHLGAPMELIGIGETVDDAGRALAANPALLVIEDGKPVSVLARPDLLTYLS
jgi:cystathionine beta-synthase